MFQQWKEEDNKFVSTRACKKVEKLIKSQNLVVVTGNSGSGKSAILQHIALRYRSHHWIVKPIYSVKEIEHEYGRQDKRQNRTLLIFNDPIGNESFDEEKYKLWKDYKERLNVCLKKIKMLVSCRRYIFNDARVSGILKDTSCTCMIDLNDDQHKLNIEEKRKMLEKYSSTCGSLKENTDEIDEIVKTEEYFPLLCKLFFSDKNNRKMGVEFFKQPIEECSKLIEHFKLESKANYCVLVLLVLFNNKLCVDDIETSDISDTKFKLALKLCGMQPETATSAIKQTLKNLEGFFIKKIRDNYHFYHDFVMEVATYVFGKDYPKEIIQYADVGFLRRRVNLENDKDQNNQFEICLSDKYSNNLGERLYREMFGDRLLDVVLNPCMRNEKLATFFIQKLNNSPDDLNKLLAKKRLYEGFKYQDGNQALEHSFGSKLDYLFYEDEMSILTAIIVFCHTKFSSHCLKEALKQKKHLLRVITFFLQCVAMVQ